MNTNYQYFGSGAGIAELSNFSECVITGKIPHSEKVYTFPSSEHYYVAYFRCSKLQDAERLAIGGDLSTWEGMRFVYPKLDKDGVEKKTKYWKRRGMIGIIAKMFAKTVDKFEKIEDEKSFWDMWVHILTSKYSQNEKHKKKLMSTSGTHLVEFDRMAKPSTRWAAKVVDGELVGQNYMGKLMMHVRDNCF